MKAKYQIPTTDYLFAESGSLLEGSLPANLIDGENLGNAPSTDETSGNLSRYTNVWDDDDDI